VACRAKKVSGSAFRGSYEVSRDEIDAAGGEGRLRFLEIRYKGFAQALLQAKILS
jgi:hypothetical protein